MAEKRRYYSLDAMRGLAAICVVAGHFKEQFAPSAHLAVDFFFVLSGFVIAKRYEDELRSGMGIMPFIYRRAERLWPLFIIGIFVGLLQIIALTFAGARSQTITDLIVSTSLNSIFIPSPMYFIQDSAMQGLFPINGPAWSMFFEMFVNVVFAIFLIRLSNQALLVAVSFFGAALVLAASNYGTLNIGWEWPSALGGFPRVLFSFSAGVLFSRFFGRSRHRSSYLSVLPGFLLMGLLVVSAEGIWRISYDLAFALILAPALVWIALFIEVPKKLASTAVWLGYISYPIYILHRGTIGIFKSLSWKVGLDPFIGFLIFMVLMTGFAFFVSKLVDAAMARRPKSSSAASSS